MSLLALSTELLLSIATWVAVPSLSIFHNSPSPTTASLASLALVSRHLNQITTPLLYHTFVQVGYSALPLLLRALVEKPELCLLVKKLVISEIEDMVRMDMLDFSQTDLEKLGLEGEDLRYFERENPEWRKQIEEGQWQAVIALLFLILPSLEEIDVESHRVSNEGSPKGYIDAALAYAAARQLIPESKHCLRCLKRVSMAYYDSMMGISIDVLLPFCALPSVTKAKIYMAADEEWTTPSPALQYNVEDLEFSMSNIAPDVLVKILRCFPRLKRLSYDNGGAVVGYEDFLPQYMGRGIAHLQGYLEELIVYNQEDVNGDEEPRSIGSLVEFKKLKKIDLWYYCLLAADADDDKDEGGEEGRPRLVDVLPASLEQLVLWQCKPDILDQLRDVLEQRQIGSSFLALKKVHIRFMDKSTEDASPETMREMKRVGDELVADAKEMGVDVVIAYRRFMMSGNAADFDSGFEIRGWPFL